MSYIGGGAASDDTAIGKGTRRRKLAGYLRAANELRQSYQSTSSRPFGDGENGDDDAGGIPGAFPDLKVTRNGNEEMILFPSYARKHTKILRDRPQHPAPGGDDLRSYSGPGDAEYWKREWEIYEDENAVVDVDVRGCIYSPVRGALSRKNRLMMSIARKLSGVPATNSAESQPSSRASSRPRVQQQDEEVAKEEVEHIMEKGEMEADIANRGGYSEMPSASRGHYSESSHSSSRNHSPKPGHLPRPITDSSLDEDIALGLPHRATSWPQPSEMSPEELNAANSNLMARLKPFMVNPAINMSLTVFFYNEETSQSRSTRTNEYGHFNLRAALNFVPTHARVLAAENLSATQEVVVTAPHGVSLISDIDDTVKHSAIGAGAREIFRNAFIRELGDLTIEGVKEWYQKMADAGVKLHYVSNSPWQMYALLVSFFAKASLPPGSFHLKQYTGMLQGIFEPVAERKRGTIDRILNDFPERRFILVGDSGEADLELYTETALMNPGRILGIFIRDVTTPAKKGFFDPSLGPLSYDQAQASERFKARDTRPGDNGSSRKGSGHTTPVKPPLPPRPEQAPEEEDLIDLSEDPEPRPPPRSLTDPELVDAGSTQRPELTRTATNPSRGLDLRPLQDPAKPELTRTTTSSSRRPSRPEKPLALRGRSTEVTPTTSSQGTTAWNPAPPIPPKPRLHSEAVFGGGTNSKLDMKADKPPVPERKSYVPHPNGQAIRATIASAYNSLPAMPPSMGRLNPYNQPSHNGTSHARDSSPASLPEKSTKVPPPTPPPRKGGLGTTAAHYASNRLWNHGDHARGDHNSASDTANSAALVAAATDQTMTTATQPVINKREEVWKRRWARARAALEGKDVLLRAWRVGQDAVDDAMRLVERAEKEAERKGG